MILIQKLKTRPIFHKLSMIRNEHKKLIYYSIAWNNKKFLL